jgi:hypothetical protein
MPTIDDLQQQLQQERKARAIAEARLQEAADAIDVLTRNLLARAERKKA